MIENINFYAAGDSSEQHFGVRWKWVYEDEEELPRCSIFACCIPESKLMEKFLIRSDEIELYINDLIKDYLKEQNGYLTSNDPRVYLKEFTQNHPKDMFVHFLDRRLRPKGTIKEDVTIPIYSNNVNDVFFLCIFDETVMEYKVMLTPSMKDEKIKFAVKKGKLDFLLGSKFLTLEITERNPNRRAILRNKIKDTYSVVPGNVSTYYLSSDIDKDDIELMYLSDLIGK